MNEHIEIMAEVGVPLPLHLHSQKYGDLRERVMAACNTAALLRDKGAQYDDELTESDKLEGAHIAAHYAEDEEGASKRISHAELVKLKPQAISYAASILDEYGHKVASSAVQIRNMVTTKLIHEAENADPKVRLKALELLGKISDVGLFSDKTEITVTHQTSDELKEKLRGKLEKLVNPESTKTASKRVTAHDAQVQSKIIETDPELDFSEITNE